MNNNRQRKNCTNEPSTLQNSGPNYIDFYLEAFGGTMPLSQQEQSNVLEKTITLKLEYIFTDDGKTIKRETYFDPKSQTFKVRFLK